MNHISILINLIFRIYQSLLSDTIPTVILSTEIPEMNCIVASYLTNRLSASNMLLRAGSSIRGSGGTVHPAAQFIVHPLFNWYHLDFNLALVKVSDHIFANLNFRQHHFNLG